MRVDFAVDHTVGECSEQLGLLRAGMIVGIFFHIVSLDMSLHIELGTVHIKMCLVGFKAQFGVIIREYKILHCQMPFVTTYTDELLVLGQERVVKAGGNSVLKEKLARKFGGHAIRTVRSSCSIEETSRNMGWHRILHRP